MPIGDRIRIVTEKEYRIMSPPRRPKGESPRTTIRFLRRQIDNLQAANAGLRTVHLDLNKQIARQDVELSEAADREEILLREGDEVAEKYGQLLARHARDSLRRQFLEGYYHAKTEALPGTGAGNQGAHSTGATLGTEARQADSARGTSRQAGGEIRGFGAHDPAPDNRGQVAAETEFAIGKEDGPRWTRR